MADIAPDHLFLRQRLLPVLLRTMVVITVHHRAAAVVPELRCRYRRPLQVPAEVFDAPPGTPGLLREVHLPAATVLRLQIALPLFFIADMPQPRQAAGVNQVMAVAQQADDGSAPDYLHGELLKEDISPGAVFNIEAATGGGEVNMRMLVELTAIGMQGTENTDLHALLAGPPEHGAGGRTEESVEQGPVVIEKGPQQVGHGKGDVLPVAVGQNMLLLCNPLLRGFMSAGTAAF